MKSYDLGIAGEESAAIYLAKHGYGEYLYVLEMRAQLEEIDLK